MKRPILLLFLLSISFNFLSQEIIEVDSLQHPWYRPSINYIQFYNRTAFQNFNDAILNSKNNKTTILHLGDSHIQSEIPTGVTRQLLQKKYGEGGRGFVFPYSAAKTYSSIHYSSKHEGNWTYAKTLKLPPAHPLGVVGMSIRTEDSLASFTLTFNSKLPTTYTEVRIYCDVDSTSYDLVFETDGKQIPIEVFNTQRLNKTGYITLTLPSISNVITLKCSKTAKRQNKFLFYGMEINSSEDKGIIYHSAGVGGGRFRGLLSSEKLMSQVKTLNPDLVILDYGTNDFLYDDSIKANLKNEIKEIITKIRVVSPITTIILCSTQDLYYHQKNIQSCEKFSQLIKSISKEMDCAFWDWYWISGGPRELKNWMKEGLARTDLIHLTSAGYKVKGKLFYDAIENSLDRMEKNKEMNSLILDINAIKNKKQSEPIVDDTLSTQLKIMDQIVKEKKSILKDSTTIEVTKTEQTSTETATTLQQEKETQNNNNSSIQNISKAESSIQNQTNENPAKINTQQTVEKINTEHIMSKVDTILPPKKEVITELKPKVNFTESKPLKINPEIKLISKEHFLNTQLVSASNTNNSKTVNKNITQISETTSNHPDDFKANNEQNQLKTKPNTQKNNTMIYKVKNGDNLSIIAAKFDISVNDLKKWNRLRDNNLSVGETLLIKR